MKSRWDSLSIQEKKTITLGAVAIAILLFYLLIWSPLDNAVAHMRTSIPEDKQLLQWMRIADQRMQTLKTLSQPHHIASTTSLLGITQKQLKDSPLEKQVTELQQVDNNTIHLV